MAEEMKKDVNVTENNQAQETANQQPHVMPQKTEDKEHSVAIPDWLYKAGKTGKKAAKILIPALTAVVGAIVGFKVGGTKASKASQVTIDGLTQELQDTRLALEQKPDPVPVMDIPATDVTFDDVPMDVVD